MWGLRLSFSSREGSATRLVENTRYSNPDTRNRISGVEFRVSGSSNPDIRTSKPETRFRVSGLLYLVFPTSLVADPSRDEKLSRKPHTAHLPSEWAQIFFFNCPDLYHMSRHIPARSSTHRGAEKGDLIEVGKRSPGRFGARQIN